MSVVGLDIGNLSCYVAVAVKGGIETIANEYSDRCTPSYVSLMDNCRCLGNSAKNQCTTNVKNTISCFKRTLGRNFTDPQVQDEINNYLKPYKMVPGKKGETLFEVQYMGEKQLFTPEQVMAMLLTKLKETGETALKTKVVDVVCSVPSYFTDIERKSMIAACQISGFNCLKVMNDTTAVALAYGIYKQDLPGENDKPRNVVFVDMGYCSLQVTVVAFNKGKLKVLAVSPDPNLGGRDFDKLLVDYFISEWRTKYKIEVLSKPKAYIRLAQECEKLKKLMSANTNSIPINIECFVDDKDVTGRMDRETFEGMAAHLLDRTETVFKKILTSSKLGISDIYSVEMVGGASRIPAVKDLVTRIFQKEPSTTLNADEAVARGCALQCAILSPTFRVRDFAIQDCQPFPINLSWQGGGLEEDASLEVFPEYHAIPFSKMLTFYRKEAFTLDASYANPDEVPIQDPYLGSFKISKVTPQANGESSKVKVKVRVNSQGIFTVPSATMIEKVEGAKDDADTETMESDQKEDEKETMQNSTEEQQPTEPMETTENGEAKTDKTEEKKDDKSDKSDKSDSADKKEGEGDKKGKKKKSTTKSIDLQVETVFQAFSKEFIHLMVEKENSMIMQDRLEKERCDAKNAVEEYVYDVRDKLSSTYEEFCSDTEREKFSQLLGATEDWLYDEGEDQKKQVYIDKLTDLKKLGDPITSRYRESNERPAAFDEYGGALQRVRKFLDLFDSKDEKFNHLEGSDVDKVRKCLKEKTEWFDKQMSAQTSMKKYENPTVLASQIRQNKQSLETTCNPIMNKPKPKPKEEPPKDEGKKGDKKEEKMEEGKEGKEGKEAPKETPKEAPKEAPKEDQLPTDPKDAPKQDDMDVD